MAKQGRIGKRKVGAAEPILCARATRGLGTEFVGLVDRAALLGTVGLSVGFSRTGVRPVRSARAIRDVPRAARRVNPGRFPCRVIGLFA